MQWATMGQLGMPLRRDCAGYRPRTRRFPSAARTCGRYGEPAVHGMRSPRDARDRHDRRRERDHLDTGLARDRLNIVTNRNTTAAGSTRHYDVRLKGTGELGTPLEILASERICFTSCDHCIDPWGRRGVLGGPRGGRFHSGRVCLRPRLGLLRGCLRWFA